MPAFRLDVYEQWRAQQEAQFLLRERDLPHPPERLLQNIWRHQRLRRDELRTADGLPLRVLHPGFWNSAAGPDFQGAVVQFGHGEPRSGDVEIDTVPANWLQHQHAGNPAYAGVILHVVWTGGAAATSGRAPTLALCDLLDMPMAELRDWAAGGASERWPESLRGQCAGPFKQLSAGTVEQILRQAAAVRFRRKAREMEARARQAGWEQALWEGLFRGLGYKQNVWAMQRVAEMLPVLREGARSLLEMQARLFGVSGFLPSELADINQPVEHLHALWNLWWRERDRFRAMLLPKNFWRMYGLRPANKPQRRLVLAAHWLTMSDFLARLEKWFATPTQDGALALSFLACLQPPRDDYWSWHWSFASPRLGKPQPLLGESRATDLAINIILPWFWARARAGQNEPLAATAEARCLAWPAADNNSVLRLARHRLLGTDASSPARFAASQQGLLQIMHDFCDQTDALCTDCALPALVRSCAAEI